MGGNGKVIAGDYDGARIDRSMFDDVSIDPGAFSSRIRLRGNVASVEMVTEENKKKFASAAGLGVLGAVALGPIGLLAGVLAGGNKKEICFACHLKDGKKFMAVADSKTYQALLAETFTK